MKRAPTPLRERALASDLADVIAARTGVPAKEILGRAKPAAVASARRELYLELWRQGFSIWRISQILERDHTSIMYGLRRILGAEAYEREVSERYAA